MPSQFSKINELVQEIREDPSSQEKSKVEKIYTPNGRLTEIYQELHPFKNKNLLDNEINYSKSPKEMINCPPGLIPSPLESEEAKEMKSLYK